MTIIHKLNIMKTFIRLATDIMGTKIKSPEGEDIGVVQNIMIDPQNGALVYIVLCYANFVGKTHRHFAIPRKMMRVKYADKASLILEIDKHKLITAHSITPSEWSMSTMHYSNPIDTDCVYELLPDESNHSRTSILKSALAN